MAKKQKKRSQKKLPWGKILLWMILLAGIYGFFSAETSTQDALLTTAVAVIGLLICYRKKLFGKKRKVKTAPATTNRTTAAAGTGEVRHAHASIEVSGRTLSYRLAGVTFQGRQRWLKKMAKLQDEFEYVQCELEPYEWKGDPACRVLAYFDDREEPVDIGNIPAAAAANVCSLLDRVTSVDVEVYGGPEYEGDDKNYGAEVTITLK